MKQRLRQRIALWGVLGWWTLGFAGNALAETGLSPVRLADTVVPTVPTLTPSEQGQVGLGRWFQTPPEERPPTARWGRLLEPLQETEFRLAPRLFYFNRHNADGTQSEALAIGGAVGFTTGYFGDRIAFGATGYTSQPLHAPKDKDGAGLLEPGQQGYSVLGEFFANVRLMEDLHLIFGRMGYDTPYINRSDSRMTPNTFEAITLQGRADLGEGSERSVVYGIGYFDAIKNRNADSFISMAEDAGAPVDRGVYVVGGKFQSAGGSIGAINYYTPDVLNIAYIEGQMTLMLLDRLQPTIGMQLTDQRSVGNHRLTGERFNSQQFGLRLDLPLRNTLLTMAGSYVSKGAPMRSPWGAYPGFTAVQVMNFDRAGEMAFMLRAAHDFEAVEGLSAFALWVHGSNPAGASEYARDEIDLNLQWSPPEGIWKNLAIRLRYALVMEHGSGAENIHDFRIIVNYALAF